MSALFLLYTTVFLVYVPSIKLFDGNVNVMHYCADKLFIGLDPNVLHLG